MASLSWLLAQRFRQGLKRQQTTAQTEASNSPGFLSFISASSTLGIALGCTVLIAGLSIMNGFQQVLENRFLKLVPHLEYTTVNGGYRDWPTALATVQQAPGVASARAVIKTQAMVQQGSAFEGLQLTGIDVSSSAAPTHEIKNYMSARVWQALAETPRAVVLGQGLADKLGVVAGDALSVLIATEQDFRQPKRASLQVVGVFEFGGELDYRNGYLALDTAQDILQLGSSVTSIEVSLDDVYQAPQLAMQIGNQMNEYVYIEHWMRSQGHLYRDIQLVRVVMYLVLILVMAVACFNIVSTLVMTVQEKLSQIAILKTMGMRQMAILRVFIWQGLQSGCLGTLLGIIGGIGLTAALPTIVAAVEGVMGASVLSGDVYFVDTIPAQLLLRDVVLVASVALLMSVLATLYPAWQAAKVAPAQALHNH